MSNEPFLAPENRKAVKATFFQKLSKRKCPRSIPPLLLYLYFDTHRCLEMDFKPAGFFEI